MRLIKRAIVFVAYLPLKLFSLLQEHRKMRTVLCDASARLLPSSKINKSQNVRAAIVVEDHSVVAGQLLVFRHAGRITIGAYCYIGECSRIWSAESVTIGN